MKKLLNYLYIPALIITLSCCFTACSDDDDDDKNGSSSSITGIWEATNLDDYGNLDCDRCTVRFSKNGDFEGYASFWTSECNFYGEYAFSDGKLTIFDYFWSGYNDISPFDEGDVYNISVSGDRLTMTYAYDSSIKLKFKRIGDSDFDFDDDDDYK